MKNARGPLLLVATLLAAGACRRGPKPGGDALPTPVSMDTAGAKATTAAAAPTVAAASGATNRAPTVDSLDIAVTSDSPGEGHPNVRDTLKANVKFSDPDGDLVTVKLSWKVNGTEIATGETLAPGKFKKGDGVVLDAVATDGRGLESGHRTANSTIRNSAPEITSIPSGSLNGYHPAATDPDNDPVTIELNNPPPGFSLSGGSIAFDPASGKAAAGKALTIVAKDNEGATTTQNITINF